jgi:hypothetical protein
MVCKALTTIVIVTVLHTSLILGSDANDYITTGRESLFDGTLSGLRSAHEIFDSGLNDPCCLDCGADRELRFLRAVSGTALLYVGDDSSPVDSVFELAERFKVDILGNYWAPYFDPCGIVLDPALNQHGAYEIPEDAPDANEIRTIIDTSITPRIEEIIADLDAISDSPGDRFRTFLEPNETRVFFHIGSSVFNPGSFDYDPNSRFLGPLEVDYGEVLLLKGVLMAMKSHLQAESAYEVSIDSNDMIAEKLYGDTFSLNDDLLGPHPDFLRVLPTPNHPDVNGKDVLAEAALDFNDAISYYLEAIDYISNEDVPAGTDPQDDELLYLDSAEKDVSAAIYDRLSTLRSSLNNDTVEDYPWRTVKTYHIEDPCSTTWELKLRYDLIGSPADDAGTFVALDGSSVPSPWEVTDITIDGNEIILEMDYDVPGFWGGALFTGILSSDGNSISNGAFRYWGPANGTLDSMSGLLIDVETEDRQFDINPIFGSSVRYPDPVSPRDLLPEFDEWNGPQPDTIGRGLGNDPTLGGITPGMTQFDWQVMLDLQPGGWISLQEVSPWQISGGYVDIWLGPQLILEDPLSDTWEDSNEISNIDIASLYMGYDDDYLYGTIVLYDYNTVDVYTQSYDLCLSYTPDDTSTLYAMKFEIDLSLGYGQSFFVEDSWGYPRWEYYGTFGTRIGPAGIDFRILWADIPSHLHGRFIALDAEGHDGSWTYWSGEENDTHLRLEQVGTISGSVSYDCYKGAPIFVQAYTDPGDPGESIVASTMILEPGPYSLEGVGLGWNGYVRAFTPLFGFNVFDLEALAIRDAEPVFMWLENIDGVDLVLQNPSELEDGIWLAGSIDADTREEDWYSFDAVEGGMYTFDLTRGTSQYASIALFGRDGHTELQELYYWQPQQISWLCLVSGRYYVKVTDDYYQPEGGTYQIRMTDDISCPKADVASAEGVGVKDCEVDLYDLAALTSHWLESCPDTCHCDGTDFDENGTVDFADFALLASEYSPSG